MRGVFLVEFVVGFGDGVGFHSFDKHFFVIEQLDGSFFTGMGVRAIGTEPCGLRFNALGPVCVTGLLVVKDFVNVHRKSVFWWWPLSIGVTEDSVEDLDAVCDFGFVEGVEDILIGVVASVGIDEFTFNHIFSIPFTDIHNFTNLSWFV